MRRVIATMRSGIWPHESDDHPYEEARDTYLAIREGDRKVNEALINSGVPLVSLEVLWLDETPRDTYLITRPATTRLISGLDYHLREYCVRHTERDYSPALARHLQPEVCVDWTREPILRLAEHWLDAPLSWVAARVAAELGRPLKRGFYPNEIGPRLELLLTLPGGPTD